MKERTPTVIELQQRSYEQQLIRPTMNDHATPPNIVNWMAKEVQELKDEIPTDNKDLIAKELADVMILLMVVANWYGIDMGEAVLEKLEYNEKRFKPDYFQHDSGMTFAEAYWKCKREEKGFSYHGGRLVFDNIIAVQARRRLRKVK